MKSNTQAATEVIIGVIVGTLIGVSLIAALNRADGYKRLDDINRCITFIHSILPEKNTPRDSAIIKNGCEHQYTR